MPYAGVGVGVNVMKNLEVNAQFTGLTLGMHSWGSYSGTADLGLFGVGITYYFSI